MSLKPERSLDLAILTVFIATLLVCVSMPFAGYLQPQVQVLINWFLRVGLAMSFIVGPIEVLKKI